MRSNFKDRLSGPAVYSAILAILIWPNFSALVDALSTKRVFWSDWAVAELYTRLAARGELLVGPYSRFGWHHPGPIWFYAMAPIYYLAGSRSAGLCLASFALNAFFLLALARELRRADRSNLGGSAALGAGLVLTLTVGRYAALPWNPFVIPLALAAFLASCASVAGGRGKSLVFALGSASFALQTHLSVAPIVLLGLGFALGFGHAGLNKRQLIKAAGLGLLLWMPTFIEACQAGGGNLLEIGKFFLTAGTDHSIREAMDRFAEIESLWIEDLLGNPLTDALRYLVLGTTLALCSVNFHAVVLRRRRDFPNLLGALVFAAMLVAGLSLLKVRFEIMSYLILWMAVLPPLALLALVLRVGSQKMAPGMRRRLGLGLLASFALLLTRRAVSAHALGTKPLLSYSELFIDPGSLQQIRAALALIPPDDSPFAVLKTQHDLWPYEATLVLEAEKAGRPPTVEPGWEFMFGKHFALSGKTFRAGVIMHVGDDSDLLRVLDTGVARVPTQARWSIDVFRLAAPRTYDLSAPPLSR